ncbi:DUF6113 family protein [Parafrankia sp. FMc2]|uniref:DUF6113 family protein n=1 Tax=Parafrankia sp. FMc2 TaxID=3233196 RepID=UPI0034D6E69E
MPRPTRGPGPSSGPGKAARGRPARTGGGAATGRSGSAPGKRGAAHGTEPVASAPPALPVPSAPPSPPAATVASVTPGPHAPGRVFLSGSYAFGVLAGFVLGLYGVVLVAAGPRPGGFLISIGLLMALIGNAGAALLVRWLTGTRLGAMIILVGWLPIVLALASSRTEGDLLLKASATGYLFLGIGVLTPVVVAVVGKARRGLTALPPMAAPPRVPSRPAPRAGGG